MSRSFNRIAMLSTHGYFDPEPMLGQTDTGGQVVFVLELSKALSEMGIAVDIYTRWFDQTQQQVNPVPGFPNVRVIRIPAGPWDFVTKEDIYPLLPGLAHNIIDFINKQKLDYDLFHGHYVDAGLVTIDVARAFGKPAYFTAHSLGAWKREQMGGDAVEMEKKFNFRHRIDEETRIFNSLNGHAVTSQLQLDKVRELYNYRRDNLEVLPPGVNIHKYHPLMAREKKVLTNLPEKYIYCLSRIDSNKGHDLLLNAFSRISKIIDDVHLVIGGGSSKPKPRETEIFDMMHQIIREKDLADKIVFVGYVDDKLMVPYYQNAQFFVMPSIFEPFGMTTQEAMSCSIPVIASKYGGISTVIKDGIDGILIDPKDENEFVNAMLRLLKDEGYRKPIGLAASELIRRDFSWEHMAEKHLDFYRKYLSKSRF